MVTESISPFTHVSQKETEYIGLQYALVYRDARHLLIMDDEEIIREVISSYVASMGYAVLEARNGLEALKICDEATAKGLRISGAILDLTISDGLGGRDVILDLRTRFPDMPIFASSAYSEDPVMVWPTGYGFSDSIGKPVRKYDLIAKLNRYLKVNS
jgi:CheY-like chemotaxis protein